MVQRLNQRDIGVDALPFDIVRIAMQQPQKRCHVQQRAFDLCGAHTVSGNVDHVIDAAGNPEIAILVTARAVAGEISAWISREICLEEALMVSKDRTHLTWRNR